MTPAEHYTEAEILLRGFGEAFTDMKAKELVTTGTTSVVTKLTSAATAALAHAVLAQTSPRTYKEVLANEPCGCYTYHQPGCPKLSDTAL